VDQSNNLIQDTLDLLILYALRREGIPLSSPI